MTEEIEEQTVSTIAVSARIPEFWQDVPRLWFIQAEAVLGPQKISDESKYHMVVAKLGKEVITQVTDILTKPPETAKYEALKSRLLSIYEESESRQVQKLISEMELGEQKPSQLLRRMQDLARGKVSDDTLSILWQNHLPSSVRGVLAVADAKDISTLASIADKVMETARPVHSIDKVDQGTSVDLVAEIRSISERLKNIECDRSRSRNRSQFTNRERSRSRRRSTGRRRTPADPSWLCSYHYRYKHRAHKCVEPCNWKKRSGQQQEN